MSSGEKYHRPRPHPPPGGQRHRWLALLGAWAEIHGIERDCGLRADIAEVLAQTLLYLPGRDEQQQTRWRRNAGADESFAMLSVGDDAPH